MLRNIILPLLVLFCALTPKINAQVTVDVRIDSLQLLVGEQTGLTLNVTLDSKQKLTLPQLKPGDELIPNVEVLEVSRPDTTMLNEGQRMEISQHYLITAWDSSFYTLPPLELMVDTQRYESRSLALKVMTLDVDTLHADKFFPPYGVMDPAFSWDDWRPIIYLSFVSLVLLLLAVYLLDRARKGKPVVRLIRRKKILPPHTQAINEIERIKAEKKWAEEDSKEYYTLLTDTLRTYIQNRYGFSAMEMTSAEIIERLTQENDPQSLCELRDIFSTADLVKFAKYSTLINENDANLVAAVQYINQTKQEPDPNVKQEPEVIRETDHKRETQIRIMRIVSVLFILCATAIAGWAIWRLSDLLL